MFIKLIFTVVNYKEYSELNATTVFKKLTIV
jgi:hypothetical protein